MSKQGENVGVVNKFKKETNPDLFGLRELCVYGLKGVAAYFFHAERVWNYAPENKKGYTQEFRQGIYKDLAITYAKSLQPGLDLGELFALNMKLGEINLRVMKALADGHIALLGKPAPAVVKTRPVEGPSILVSGHDLIDLLVLLE